MGARAASSGLAVVRRALRQPLCNEIRALCGFAAELSVKPVTMTRELSSRPEATLKQQQLRQRGVQNYKLKSLFRNMTKER